MWLDLLPLEDDALRQGDLLRKVPFPSSKGQPDGDGVMTRVESERSGLVIEHCCNIEQCKVVRIARIELRAVPTGSPLDVALKMTNPGEVVERKGKRINFPVRLMGLDQHSSLASLKPDSYFVAQLIDTVEFSGDLVWLQQKRSARMTANARWLLRTKLAALYGRAEADDAAELEKMKLPSQVTLF